MCSMWNRICVYFASMICFSFSFCFSLSVIHSFITHSVTWKFFFVCFYDFVYSVDFVKNAVLVELIRFKRVREKVINNNNNNNKISKHLQNIQKNFYMLIQCIDLYLDIGSIFILNVSIYHRRAITEFVWIEYLFFNPLFFSMYYVNVILELYTHGTYIFVITHVRRIFDVIQGLNEEDEKEKGPKDLLFFYRSNDMQIECSVV